MWLLNQPSLKGITMQEELTQANTEHDKLIKKIKELEDRNELLTEALKQAREDIFCEERDKFRKEKKKLENEWQKKIEAVQQQGRNKLEEKKQIIRSLYERLELNQELYQNELDKVKKKASADTAYLKEIIFKFRDEQDGFRQEKEELENEWQKKIEAVQQQERNKLEEKKQIIRSLYERLELNQELYQNELDEVKKKASAEKHYSESADRKV